MNEREEFNNAVKTAMKMQGRKIVWLAFELGLTTTSIHNKMSGKNRWTKPEKYVLKRILFL